MLASVVTDSLKQEASCRRSAATRHKEEVFSDQMTLMRRLSVFFSFIKRHLLGGGGGTPQGADGAVVGRWGQRYTAPWIQIGRQLPPLTYTLSLWDLRPAGKIWRCSHGGGSPAFMLLYASYKCHICFQNIC